MFIAVIRGQNCINLTQTGLKPVGFMQTPHTPRPRTTEYGLCTLVKRFTNSHPIEASPQGPRRPPPVPLAGQDDPTPHKVVGGLLRPFQA